MTVVCYPLDAVAGAPTYTGRMLRDTIAALLGGASTARPLGAFSGVRPGTPTNTVVLSGLNWTCNPHAGVLDVQAAAEAGPYLYAVTVDEIGTLNAAAVGNARTDLLVATLSDPAEADGSSVPKVEIVYVPGTAGPGAPAPSTPARSMVLARFNVPQSGGGSPTVTWVAPTLFAAGARASVSAVADLALLSAYTNMEATVEATPGAFWKYDGSTWVMHGVARFATANARDTAITAPVSGMSCAIGTRQYIYAGTKWHREGYITPTTGSVTGTSAAVDSDGVVQLVAVTAVTLSGIDATLFGPDSWEIAVEGTSAAGGITMQAAAGGTADTTANHDWFGNGENQASTDVAATSLAQTTWPISNGLAPVEFLAEIRFRNAKSASRKTRGLGRFEVVVTAETAKTLLHASVDHRATTSFDGVKLMFASAFTGTIEIRR